MGEYGQAFSLYINRRIIEMAVKYPEFNELKKESAFDWLVKSAQNPTDWSYLSRNVLSSVSG